jgi:hypothetical protein
MSRNRVGLLVLAVALTNLAAAQGVAQSMETVRINAAPGPVAGKVDAVSLRIDGMDVTPVKGSPFCATVVNEHTQQFADGNRIHTTENSTLCRDSEGRTRRESQLNLLGAAPQANTPKLITIIDPVANVRYTLDTAAKIARKMRFPPLPPPPPGKAKAGQPNVMFYTRTAGPGPEPIGAGAPATAVFMDKKIIRGGDQDPPNSESLGDQTINGIQATGTRITTTIPAGQMGNELPMNIVSEDWYSPELKATVMTKHSDPWAGQLTTQFTNVNTAEPDASLFTIPADYKVVDEKDAGPFTVQFQRSVKQ